MAAGDFVTQGSSTINASQGNTTASVTVSDGSLSGSEQVYVQATALAGQDARKTSFSLAVTDVSTDEFTVEAEPEGLEGDVTFEYIAFATA